MWTRVRARGVLEWEGTQPARSVLIRGCPFDSVAPRVPTSQACATALCLQAHPGMETPLDVLSRAASLVHADDEKRESPVFSTSCAELKLPASPPGLVTVLVILVGFPKR